MRLTAATTGLLLVTSQSSLGFQPAPKTTTSTTQHPTVVWGKKVKRGELGRIAEGIASTPKKPKSASKKKKAAAGGTVSPDLAQWAQQEGEEASPATEPETTVTTASSNDDAATFTSFKETKKSSSRRQKQSIRKQEEEERNQAVLSTLTTLDELLEEKSGATLDDIVEAIRPLLSLQSESLRTLTAGAKVYDYRLAWVGGDDCLTHIGTGLHKVPLARMQEVFLTLEGRNRMKLLEVIRVLGPFPNVLNILQGDSKTTSSSSDVSEWEIVMDSMVDGTGKELLAGTEDNIRRVKLQVYFCNQDALLAVVPPEEGVREDPLEQNGQNVLLYVREDDLETKLDQLRVSEK